MDAPSPEKYCSKWKTAKHCCIRWDFASSACGYHGEMVRIEIAREEMPRALNMETMDRMTAGFRALGFKYVTLDCEGYRSGSMNAILPVEAIRSVNLQ